LRNLRAFVQVVRVSTRTMTHERVQELVAVADDEHQQRWSTLVSDIESRFGRMPDVDAILFLIGAVCRPWVRTGPAERAKTIAHHGGFVSRFRDDRPLSPNGT